MAARRGLRFTESTHRYYLDGRPVPGVTTILGVLDKPAIPRWAAAQVAEYVADHFDAVEHLRAMGRDPMVAALKGIPWQKRDDAAARGSTLHKFAEQILRGEEVEPPDELFPVVENAVRFMDEWDIDPILIEYPCASREHWWAGTGDLIARYRNPSSGRRGVGYFDWKSARGVYAEHSMQFAAYTHPEFWGLDGNEQTAPECDASFGVHIRPDDYDVHPYRHGPGVYEEFLAIRRVYDIAKRMRGDWKKPGSGYMGLPIHAPHQEIA